VRPYCPVASLLGKPLSPRERQIGKLLVEGLPNKEIAWCLKLSIGTIKVYSSALFGKLGSRNRMHAAVMLATTAADRLLV
jgi:non-specific serine/threonine protein kinase